eukprot:SAG31_NODE_618_length_13513_cov_87.043164_6_plen_82_part_00
MQVPMQGWLCTCEQNPIIKAGIFGAQGGADDQLVMGTTAARQWRPVWMRARSVRVGFRVPLGPNCKLEASNRTGAGGYEYA